MSLEEYKQAHETPMGLLEKSYQSIVDLLVGSGLITNGSGEEPVLDKVLETVHKLFGDADFLGKIYGLTEQNTGGNDEDH
jgi:hypothetical protein